MGVEAAAAITAESLFASSVAEWATVGGIEALGMADLALGVGGAASAVGGASGGAVSLSEAAALTGAAASAFNALNAGSAVPKIPGQVPAPIAPPTMQSPQVNDAAATQRRRAAAAGGIMSNIRTSPQGITGAASTTGKNLLGN